jgi:pimeloyl-ACP methyl ester carboxylesterase
MELVRRLADRPNEALPHAHLLAELNPLDEGAQAQVVRLLATAGRMRDAERQYQAAALILEAGQIAETGVLRDALNTLKGMPRTGPAMDTFRPDDQALVQEIRFCTATDGTRIAYSIAGEGPPIVKTANWLNHLEYDWESPIWRHVMRFLARNRTSVRYDERGNGLSDWELREASLEAYVSDLEAVVDSVGLKTFPLLAISQGCAVAIAYAARHPERVSRLVLHGGYAVGWRLREDPDGIAAREAMQTLVRTGWGQETPAFRQVFTSLFFPDATAGQMQSFNELQRKTTSPENAYTLLNSFSSIDARPYLSKVKAPVLVAHWRGDLRVPFEEGRKLAANIPGARFVPLDSANHLMLEHEPAWSRFVAEVEPFLAADS